MRAIKTQKGFTIIETMIVLAITGVLFVATTMLVSGQIQRYQFRESSLNTKQKLIDSINDVSVGYFDVVETSTEVPGASGHCKAANDSASGATSEPGKSDCVYVGKKIVISSGSDPKMTESAVVTASDITTMVGVSATSTGPSKTIKSDEVSERQTNMPSSLDYYHGDVFYVLFDRLSNNTDPLNNKGEGLSVSLYGLDGSGNLQRLINGVAVCAKDGGRYVSYLIGKDGSPTVEMDYSRRTDWGCP